MTTTTKSISFEASDLGLAPGHWPLRLAIPRNVGGLLYRTGVEYDAEGEVVSVRYSSEDGPLVVTVFND